MSNLDDICGYCLHSRRGHHRGCNKCLAIPSTHGLYCDEPLCCCTDFMEPDTLSDEDVAALMGETA